MILSNLSVGSSAKVIMIEGNEKLKKRLMALGCVQGTLVMLKGRAPLKDPIIIHFRGFDLAIRIKDAAHIIVS